VNYPRTVDSADLKDLMTSDSLVRRSPIGILARYTLNLGAYDAALRRLGSLNPSAQAVTDALSRPFRTVRTVRHAWVDPPRAWRVETYRPDADEDSNQIIGFDSVTQWQWVPGLGYYSEPAGTQKSAEEQWRSWIDAELLELITPSVLWDQYAEGQRSELMVGAGTLTSRLGRPAWRSQATISDWETRFVGWSGNFFIADSYEVDVDAATGAILRVACIADEVPYRIGEISFLAEDAAIETDIFSAI
jgi:hypothetical protein